MCGICGVLTFDASAGQPEQAKAIEVMSGLMARRGPDDERTWIDPAGHLHLGFRRLAILDLSPTGRQPMLTDDGRYAMVLNGEIYNFRELRSRLESEGVRFRSSGDAEVALHALARWGTAALDRMNGMFALAFYDSRNQQLLIARDHAGIKPLYYTLTARGAIFASQYNQILAHPWSRSLPVSPDALALFLRLGYIPAPHALLESTAMLEAGAWLEISTDGRTRKGHFFRFPQSRDPDLRGAEALEAVDAAVTAAVRRQMVSDVPLGTFLSGGIDSPLVAAKSQAASTQRVHAFTIGLPGTDRDETEDAARYAEALGLEHESENASGEQALAMLSQVIEACGEPLANSSLIPTMLVSKLARRKVKVVLSGDGGDELFWGYYKRFAAVMEKSRQFDRPYWQRRGLLAAKKLLHIGKDFTDLRWPTIGTWYRAKHSLMPERWLRRLFPTLPDWPSTFTTFDYAGRGPDEIAQWLRWNEFAGQLSTILLKVDRASMYHGLEVRVPLLDREVVEVALRVDWRTCLDLDRGVGKLPLRQALARHTAFQTTSKRGFGVPVGEWLKGPLRPVFEEKVLGRRDLLGIPLKQAAARRMFDQHLAGDANYAQGLWLLLTLSLWEETHFRPHRVASAHHRAT